MLSNINVSLRSRNLNRVNVFCNFFFFNSPNFFILDEPTNHLDMETIEALGKSLHKFQVSNGIGIYN